jgi:phage terminase large subunit
MKLHPAQAKIALDTHRFRVVNCGRRFGKSELAAWEMKATAVLGNGTRVVYVAPTFQQARDIAWQTLKRVCQDAIVNTNETRLELTLRNKYGTTSSLWLRGWEAIETLRGQRFDLVVLDEVAMMKSFWAMWQEVVRPTLTDTRGRGLFLSTPKGLNHFRDLYNLQDVDSDFKSFHFTSYDNPYIPKDEIDKARNELTEDRFAQEYLADFRKTQGLVYKDFDRARHVFTDMGIIKSRVRKLVGIDWGWTNPTAVLEFIEDGDRNFYIVSEWYKTEKPSDEIIEYAASLNAQAYYPDPAEPDRIALMLKRKLPVRDVSKDIVAGIDSVQKLIRAGKLFVHSSCVNTISEFETYSYPDKKPDKNTPEVPIKENDHALDCARYTLHMASMAQATTQAPVRRTIPAHTPYAARFAQTPKM